jgi:hypothetical protein
VELNTQSHNQSKKSRAIKVVIDFFFKSELIKTAISSVLINQWAIARFFKINYEMTRGMGEEIFEHKFGISENGGHCWRRVGKRQRKVRQLFKDHVQIKKRKKKIRNLGFVF